MRSAWFAAGALLAGTVGVVGVSVAQSNDPVEVSRVCWTFDSDTGELGPFCMSSAVAPPTTVAPTTTVPPTTTTTVPPTTTPAPTTTSTTTTTTTVAPTTTVAQTNGDEPGEPDGFGGVWPGEATTGPTGALTPVTPPGGYIEIRTPGVVIDSQDIDGCLVVLADMVTVSNSIIRPGPGCFFGIYEDGQSGLVVTDSLIDCGQQNMTAIGFSNFELHRSEIRGCENGPYASNNVTIADNYVHDIYEGASGHGDAAQVDGTANGVTIRHNTLIGSSASGQQATSAIIASGVNVADVTIDRNLLGGGAATLYCPRSSGDVGFDVTSNRFTPVWPPAFYSADDCNDGDGIWSDNLEAGTLDPI